MNTTNLILGDFSSIMSAVIAARLNRKQVNDLKVTPAKYKLAFCEPEEGEERIKLELVNVDDNTKKYTFSSVYQLAALRFQRAPLTIKWTDEFEYDTVNGFNFQQLCMELQAKGRDVKDIVIEVVANLGVRNKMASDRNTPVYEDICYTDQSIYVAGIEGLFSRPDFKTWILKPGEFGRAKAKLRNALHKSALIAELATEANLVKLPIFRVVN